MSFTVLFIDGQLVAVCDVVHLEAHRAGQYSALLNAFQLLMLGRSLIAIVAILLHIWVASSGVAI